MASFVLAISGVVANSPRACFSPHFQYFTRSTSVTRRACTRQTRTAQAISLKRGLSPFLMESLLGPPLQDQAPADQAPDAGPSPALGRFPASRRSSRPPLGAPNRRACVPLFL